MTSSQQQVRLGVVGLGNIAQQHIRHILDGQVAQCSLAATCSRNQPTGYNLPAPHFTELQALLDSRSCDAVLIATPTKDHLAMGRAALSAGLHVLMEKPIGLSVAEGQQLLDCATGEQVFALMLNQRTDPVFQAMKHLLDKRALGDIQRTHWTMTHWFRPEIYFQASDWRATWAGEGGGLLVNQCIHNLDIFQWLCGMPTQVTAQCQFGRYHDIEVEDEASALLRYNNGATGVFIASTGEAPGFNRLDIIGDLGTLSYDGTDLQVTRNSPGTGEYSRTTRDMFGMPDSAQENITPRENVNQHALVISNFVAAILRGESLIAPASEGLASLSLANAILLSSWRNAAVNLPLDAAAYQEALDAKIRQSKPRRKSDVEVNIDMEQSYR